MNIICEQTRVPLLHHSRTHRRTVVDDDPVATARPHRADMDECAHAIPVLSYRIALRKRTNETWMSEPMEWNQPRVYNPETLQTRTTIWDKLGTSAQFVSFVSMKLDRRPTRHRATRRELWSIERRSVKCSKPASVSYVLVLVCATTRMTRTTTIRRNRRS